MSGFSSDTRCPNCNEPADIYTEWEPYDYIEIWCPYCGFHSYPKIEYMTLEELNTYRMDNNLPRLKKLPKQEFTQ